MGKPQTIDCFCGAGGLSLGFSMAGFETTYAFDSDPACIRTYSHNLEGYAEERDIASISKSSIEGIVGKALDNFDVVMGGPPCQGFSVQRRGNDSDPRNNLVLEFVRLVLEIQPRFFLMENVGGLLSPRGKQFLNHLNERCRKAGYFLTIAKLNSFDFGVPQIRKRVFIVGELTQNVFPRFSLPKGIKNRITFPSTVRQAIEDLILKTETEIPNHKADKLSAINLARIRSIEEGEGRESLPPELQLNCHNNNAGHRHLDVYGRLAWDLPSPTITARFDSFSRGRFGHPILDRTITLREGARLQSFPDDFVFSGTKVQVAQQIGNAVPPLLALALAESIKTALE